MNERESRLSRELDAEAERLPVNVDAMWQGMADRLGDDEAAAAPSRPRRQLVPFVAGIAAAGVIAAIVIPLANRAADDRSGASSVSGGPTVEGDIGSWACAYQVTLSPAEEPDFSGEAGEGVESSDGDTTTTVNEGGVTFVAPRITVDPAKAPQEAVDYGVPYYHFDLDGDTGTLDYGDANGHLIARTQLTRSRGDWVLGDREVCVGLYGLPSADPTDLGSYTGHPLPFPTKAPQVQQVPPTGDPVVIDDRRYYNEAGMYVQSTLYAYPTEKGVQLVSAPFDDSSWGYGRYRNVGFAVTNIDNPRLGAQLYDFRGWDQGDVFAYFSAGPDDVVSISTARESDGIEGYPMQTYELPSGTLFVTKPPKAADGDINLTITHADGSEETTLY